MLVAYFPCSYFGHYLAKLKGSPFQLFSMFVCKSVMQMAGMYVVHPIKLFFGFHLLFCLTKQLQMSCALEMWWNIDRDFYLKFHLSTCNMSPMLIQAKFCSCVTPFAQSWFAYEPCVAMDVLVTCLNIFGPHSFVHCLFYCSFNSALWFIHHPA